MEQLPGLLDEIDDYVGDGFNKNDDSGEDALMKTRTVLLIHCLTMLAALMVGSKGCPSQS